MVNFMDAVKDVEAILHAHDDKLNMLFEQRVKSVLKELNRNRAKKISALASMGTIAFYDPDEPLDDDKLPEPLAELLEEWTYVLDNLNIWLYFDLTQGE